MKRIILLLAITASLPAHANKDSYELKKAVRAGNLTAVKSSQGIRLITEKAYDKYIISISGDDNFSYQFESDTPVLNLYDLNLPYDGSYNYEIKAVKYIGDRQDTMNNGRDKHVAGKVSLIDVKSGQFINSYGEMMLAQDIKEPTQNSFPKLQNK
ncbi:MAG: hypothetical protein ACPG46_01780 [Thalassotalea sp.]